MFDTRLTVTNHERWGKLVKTWSTGKNYLEDDRTYPVPQSLEEFKTQLGWAQVGANVPANYKKLEIVVHPDGETLVIKLPPKDEIKKSEDHLTSGDNSYPIPEFYGRTLFGGKDPAGPRDREALLNLHAARIGDYTVSICV